MCLQNTRSKIQLGIIREETKVILWRRVLLEKLTVAQLEEILHSQAHYVFIRTRHVALF